MISFSCGQRSLQIPGRNLVSTCPAVWVSDASRSVLVVVVTGKLEIELDFHPDTEMELIGIDPKTPEKLQTTCHLPN